MPTEPKMRVAIVHDWLHTYRGGEKVLEAICELYPQADLFTLFYRPGKLGKLLESRKITTSFLNGLPGIDKYYRYLLPLFPSAAERLNLQDYDLVISTSHCVAKGVLIPPHAKHVSYVFTPMRYIWDAYQEYFGSSKWEKLIFPFSHYLRLWDTVSSHRVDKFLCLSKFVQQRIEKNYRRDAKVIYPFADLKSFSLSHKKGEYYLIVSALSPYKRIEIAIEACNALRRPLWIVGEGPMRGKLEALAGDTIRFLGGASAEELPGIYQNCRAFLFPGLEDFGITPLEAMASGKPVIAFGKGGVSETVIEGKTGLFFDEQTADSLKDAIEDFEKAEALYTPENCRARAEVFTRYEFQKRFLKAMNQFLSAPVEDDSPRSERPAESPAPLSTH